MPMHDELHFMVPSRDEISDWVMLLRESRWMGFDEMMAIHIELHRLFGDNPSEAVYEGERELSQGLRSIGLEHRYDDALSKAAGTYVENQVEADLEEVHWYLKKMVLNSSAVQLFQGAEGQGQIFAEIDDALLPTGMKKTILKSLNKMMPPGVTIKPAPKKPREEFKRVISAYDLILYHSQRRAQVQTKPWKAIVDSAPALVLKASAEAGELPAIEVQLKQVELREVVLKEGVAAERYVLSRVLIPEEEDTQNEIYSRVEVLKACHWWAENNGQFSHRHVLQGGQVCGDRDIVMLENYCMPCDGKIGDEEIKAGTWMIGARLISDDLWNRAVRGELGAWSMGAEVTSYLEEITVGQ